MFGERKSVAIGVPAGPVDAVHLIVEVKRQRFRRPSTAGRRLDGGMERVIVDGGSR